jgi:threonine 3-dehydrogenase
MFYHLFSPFNEDMLWAEGMRRSGRPKGFNSFRKIRIWWNSMPLDVLITGGTGFIGSYLANALRDAGNNVTLLDIVPRMELLSNAADFEIIRGDIANFSHVLDAAKGKDVIYHTGALLSASAEERPLTAYHTNLGGTFHILEAARLFDINAVVFTSTVATFGSGLETVDDETLQRPTTMYGVCKVASERLGEYYHRKFGVNFRGVRFPSIIGAGRGPGGASAYTTLMVEYPAGGKPYDVYVKETTRMPILYIHDAVQALLQLYDAKEEDLKRRVYNIGGLSPSAGEIAALVRKHVPNVQLFFKPTRELVDIVESWPRALDDTCARDEWSWKHIYDLNALVEDFVRSVQLYNP